MGTEAPVVPAVKPVAPVTPPVVAAVAPVVPPVVPAVEPPVVPPVVPAVEPPAMVAPEKYELTLPDGGHMEQSDLTRIEAMAREYAFDNATAQSLVQQHHDVMAATAAQYLVDTKADKDYGGEKFSETERLAKAIVTKIRPEGHPRREAFLRFMGRGGGGNHVEVLSFLADLGKLTAEDRPTGGSGGAGAARDAASILYAGKS